MLHPNDIRMILNDEEYVGKYEKFMLRRVLVAEPDARWCPAPDCGFVVIASGCAGCPKLQCHRPGCDTNFCYHCKQEWHPNQTCDAARQQRARATGRASSSADSIDVLTGHSRHRKDSDIKPCPTCKVLIIKMDDGSCNHMTCSVCGTEFCWLCMKQINDLHYLSPSGCTFWGKKPWSRKKKIMWQLGMLVGAPVGIALIAGIAVPAIIIGIPVWVGRKLHARFSKRESMKRKNRNLMVATGVIASVAVSPILALVAVGIGIPILLAYVYGVVPISLCRSGGCGVENDLYRDIRFPRGGEEGEDIKDVDTESAVFNKVTIGRRRSDRKTSGTITDADGLSVDTALSGQKGTTNPSIGEMSLGMSTSFSMMGSGYHLDRADRDQESASNAPLHGSIASTSHRLDVHTDVSSNKRSSFSSETTSACGVSVFSEKMSNSYALDDGTSSTRGLAGSIISRLRGDRRGSRSKADDTTSSKSCDDKTTATAYGAVGGSGGPPVGSASSSRNSVSTSSPLRTTPVDVYVQIDSGSEESCEVDARERMTSSASSRIIKSSSKASTGSGGHHTVITIPTKDISEPQSSNNPSTSRCVSFQPPVIVAPSATQVVMFPSPMKSRSLEHLSIFCDYCHSSHRPCCPNNYRNTAVVSGGVKGVATVPSSGQGVLKQQMSVDEPHSLPPHFELGSTTASGGRGKSTTSTSPSKNKRTSTGVPSTSTATTFPSSMSFTRYLLTTLSRQRSHPPHPHPPPPPPPPPPTTATTTFTIKDVSQPSTNGRKTITGDGTSYKGMASSSSLRVGKGKEEKILDKKRRTTAISTPPSPRGPRPSSSSLSGTSSLPPPAKSNLKRVKSTESPYS